MEEPTHTTNLLEIDAGSDEYEKKSYAQLASTYGLHAVLVICIFLIVAVFYNAPTYWLTILGGAAIAILGWLAIH